MTAGDPPSPASSPAARRAALEALLASDWETSRREVLDLLHSGTWPERGHALERLDERFGEIGAPLVLDVLRAAGAQGIADPPVTREDRETLALAEAGLGLVLLRLGDLDLAEGHCARARELAPRTPCRARARADHHVALLLLRRRDTEPALALLRRALETYQHVEDRDGEAEVLDTMGSVHFERLELAEAEFAYRRSLAIKLETGDLLGQAMAYGNLGRLAAFRGETEEALDCFFRDRRIAEQLGDDHGVSLVGNQLADLYLRSGDHERARELASVAAAAAERSHDPRDLAYSLRTRGRLALEEGDSDQAMRLADASRDRFLAIREDEQACIVELLRAEILRRRGDIAAAQPLIEDVRQRFAASGNPAGEARACIQLALLHQRAGHPKEEAAAVAAGVALTSRLPPTALQQELFRLLGHVQVGSWLIETGSASPALVDELIETAYAHRQGLATQILAARILDAPRLARLLRDKAGIESVSLEELSGPAVRRTAAAVPRRLCERMQALPLRREPAGWVVAMADPLDFLGRLRLSLALGGEVRPVLAEPVALANAIRLAHARPRLGLDRHADAALASHHLLETAIADRASDVHLEPLRDTWVVRLRVDGVLHEMDRISLERGRALANRLKVMGSMDIADKRHPQDGRGRHVRDKEAWNLRLATLPCLHGEKVVVRLLGQSRPLTLAELGLDDGTAAALRRVSSRQEGMLLVVGPTGSGKSTTLQAVLAEIDAVERSVFTIEDPVEFEVPAFAQTQVDLDAGYGFADALKALLRQDPNVILLGEIRDVESATIATRLALTGHLVLSTLHTYDAAAAVTRLVQMGIPDYLVAATVKVVLAQRLVRRLCTPCSKPEPLDREWLRSFGVESALADMLAKADLRTAGGCERCGHRGYSGRLPIFEYMPIDADAADVIRGGRSEAELRVVARQTGMRNIAVSGLHRVAAGETSQAELMRVL